MSKQETGDKHIENDFQNQETENEVTENQEEPIKEKIVKSELELVNEALKKELQKKG